MSNLRNKTVKAIGWNVGTTIFSQIFGVVVAIILTRELDPDDFGLIAMVTVFTGFAGILSNFGFSGALVQRKTIVEGHKSSVFWINMAIGLFLTILLFLLAPFVAQFYGDERLILVTRILAINFTISSLNIVQFSLVSRRIDFKTISTIRVVTSITSGIVATIMALNGYGYWSLIAQTMLLSTISVIIYWYISAWRPKFIFEKERVKDLFSFGMNVTILRVLNFLSSKLDVLLMGRMMGADTLGVYSRSSKFQRMPFMSIKGQMGAVLFPTFSKLQDDKPKQADIYIKLTALMTLIMSPILMGLFSVADEFVVVVLTDKWIEAIPLIRVFSVAFLFSAIGFPQITFTSNDRTNELLKITTVLKTIRIILITFSIFYGTILDVAWAASISKVINQITMNYCASNIMGISFRKIINNVLPFFIASFLMAAFILSIDLLILDELHNAWRLVIKILIGIIFYLSFLILFKPNPLPYMMDQFWPLKIKSIKSFLE